ncbi:hypothetical protein DY000_02011095 [Brassica cretica]|uniref:Kinesin motor domain-containing protein n=1 Tax=Brassica cretica TaxID=69181 RepID=A0ABQ7CNE5_BRACR|nr:hypothetical protein DY000_02011095 [Brassica cretica]
MESDDCSVKVAVHIRPLIGDERLQGCKDCVTVVSGKPQVQIGSHSFTFDHVYGSTGTPSTEMYQECAAPLVDGLFQGYNATVLAYGQTGSGKTYTMGTGCGDTSQTGIVPQVMNALFTKIETLKDQIEFQIHVSFIEIHKEEVQDLLDPSTINKSDTTSNGKVAHVPGKPPIQIRESSNGVITLAGSTEVSVSTLKEMAACLDQGSVSRATGSTNMNNQSSRSHAIFTITVEQMRKINTDSPENGTCNGSLKEEYLCAKLHLALQRWLDHELEVMVNVHEVRHEYEKQSHVRAALAEELSVLRQVDEFAAKGLSPPRGKNGGFARASSLSPNARMARISSLENMLGISSNSLVAMASQLSEAEERERAFTSRGRWNQLRSMGEAKNLLQYMFNSLAETRCQVWEKDGTPPSAVKHLAEDMNNTHSSPMTVPAQKQLKFTPGIANGKVRDSAAFINANKKMVPMGQVSMRKLSAVGQQSGKLWRWKRSHHQWIVQFKWKWQKPWRLSEWIRHSDETLLKAKPRHKALPNKITNKIM